MRDDDFARPVDGAAYPYPQPQNHIQDDPTPGNQAIYVPSISPSFALNVYRQSWSRDLPHGVTPQDLNPLAPNGLFQLSHVMYSAGQALGRDHGCIITERDRAKTVLICDSGGYQVATRGLHISTNREMRRYLDWLEPMRTSR